VPPANNAQGANANAGANNQQQQQQQALVVAYQSTFYNGTLPAPTGEVGMFINRTVSHAGFKTRRAAEACFLPVI